MKKIICMLSMCLTVSSAFDASAQSSGSGPEMLRFTAQPRGGNSVSCPASLALAVPSQPVSIDGKLSFTIHGLDQLTGRIGLGNIFVSQASTGGATEAYRDDSDQPFLGLFVSMASGSISHGHFDFPQMNIVSKRYGLSGEGRRVLYETCSYLATRDN